MMEKLIARGEELARQAQADKVQQVAQQLRSLFGTASVDALETQILVRGRGLIKRWLYDPSLRFLFGGLK
jgi:hypothetical protein